jgi:transcriptional regulator GlxA family with amidase domain
MKYITLFAAPGAMASQLTGVIDFFMICNQYWMIRNQTHDALFQVSVVSPSGGPLRCSGGMTLDSITFEAAPLADAALIIGGVSYDQHTLANYFKQISPLSEAIRSYARQSIVVGSFCSSTFVAAELGLLENKSATTVWWLAKMFNQMYPNIHLNLDELVVKDDGIFTAGATTSYLSLCLEIVETLFDDHLADQVSRLLLVEPNRCSQKPYMILNLQDRHHDSLIKDIQKWMNEHVSEPITLDRIADTFAVTKRTLNRRFKKALADTPVNYLQKLRVENAKRLLECGSLNLEQIVTEVGYEDVSSFRKLFVELVELTPREYRERFQQGINIDNYATT